MTLNQNGTERPEYSIIFPAYNEALNISPLLSRITQTMEIVDETYEILAINNGSFDDTGKILAEMIMKHKELAVVTLSRNFGYDGAITAGLEHCSGKYVIIMDGDQQDPPEEIPRFIEKAKEGYDIVYGIRSKRTEGFFLGFMIKSFYKLWQKIVSFEVPKDAGNFGVLSRRVVDTINETPERNKFIRGLRAWTGFLSCGLEYKRNDRTIGLSKFSFFPYLNHALNGITSFSTFPLRMFTYLGAIGMLFCISLGAFFFITKIFQVLGYPLLNYDIVTGFTSLALILLTTTSFLILGLGIIGEYVGRIFEEVKHRPNFVVLRFEKNIDGNIQTVYKA